MFGKKKNKPVAEAPEELAEWVVKTFADHISALEEEAVGKRLEVWIGANEGFAQEMQVWVYAQIKGLFGAEKTEKTFEVVLETEKIREKIDAYRLYVVRK